MDCIMSISTHAYEIVQIPHTRVEILTLTGYQGIDMMHDNAVMNLISFDPQITSEISSNCSSTSLSPNIALVETLIHPSGSAERLSEKCSVKREILESFFECV
nr:MAG TPA: hypothetical protein [Caudoviricetes sp.]